MSLHYNTLSDKELLQINIGQFVDDGVCLLWFVNSKRELAEKFILKNGFKIVDMITWIKRHQSGKLRRPFGYYTQHAAEFAFLAVKGNVNDIVDKGKIPNVIESNDTLVGEKPEELYTMLKQLVPGETVKLELFARTHNVHSGWASAGLDLREFFHYNNLS